MTIDQAHNYIKLEIDKTSSLELPALEPEELDYWLDDAILSYTKTHYSGSNVKGESFERSQKRQEDLKLLLVEDSSLSPSAGSYYANSVLFDLSNLSPNYLYSVREESISTYNGDTVNSDVTVTTHDKVNVKLQDPYSEHNLRLGKFKPLRLMVGENLILIGDGNYTITGLNITYIKTPTKVADNPGGRTVDYVDLTDETMYEIVKIAATKILENFESSRVQSHMLINSQKE